MSFAWVMALKCAYLFLLFEEIFNHVLSWVSMCLDGSPQAPWQRFGYISVLVIYLCFHKG